MTAHTSAEERINGIDLHLPTLPVRRASELERALRGAITQGRLPRGSRLPSARQLAADLGMSRNTVAEVYARLTAEGVLRATVGAGTWVADTPAAPSSGMVGERRSDRHRFDLRAGIADSTDFPAARWVAAAEAALRDPDLSFGYAPPEGDPMLRDEVSRYLARTRGCLAAGGRVLVGHGFGELLAQVARALVERGVGSIAVEQLGHQQHRDILTAAGLRLVTLGVDEEGARVERLDDCAAGAVLLTPAHQFPTGFALSSERRERVADWALRTGGVIVEDDYDGEFRYDRRSIGALQSMAPDHTVYLGTASKSVAPALGTAWALAPDTLAEAMTRHRVLLGAAASAVHERTLAHFIAAHDYDRTARARRATFRSRRLALTDLLARRAPAARVEGLQAGLHCLVVLPDDEAAERALSTARRLEIIVHPLSHFQAPNDDGLAVPRWSSAIVVGFGAASPSAAAEALARFVEAVRSATTGQELPTNSP